MSAPDGLPVHAAKEREARGYSWEIARTGNYLALRHGAYSERTVGRLVDELVAAVLVDRPDLVGFPFALAAWARAETRAALLMLYLDSSGVVDEEGQPRERLLRELRSEERRASDERRELGLSPRAAAGLARERAEAALSSWSADGIVEAGRRVIDATATDGRDG